MENTEVFASVQNWASSPNRRKDAPSRPIYSRVDLFSNYLEDPQNVDVRWDVQLNMTVNKWFSANISTNLIYDNDTKIVQKDGSKGPRLQFKESLGVGFQVTF